MSKRKLKLKRPALQGYRYIQKDSEWLESLAYRDLNPLARCLLEEFLVIYRDSRNGHLSISTRRAAERLGVSENTVLKAFDDLVEHGFLKLTGREVWTERLAREWELTMMPRNGREPIDDWKQWAPGNPIRLSPRAKKKTRIERSEAGCLNISGNPASINQAKGRSWQH